MTEPRDTTRPEDSAEELPDDVERHDDAPRSHTVAVDEQPDEPLDPDHGAASDTERPPASHDAHGASPEEHAEDLESTAHERPEWANDPERTVNLTGADLAGLPLRDDVENPPPATDPELDGENDRPTHVSSPPPPELMHEVSRAHLKGLLEALIFVSDHPIKTGELAKAASATAKEARELLAELAAEYSPRGIQLDEVAGGWLFRTNAQYAPFVRDLTKQKPVKLSRAQVETLSILAYRQPITRPEIDEIRGVDSGATLKLLLERDLIKILGKKDEPGRPLLYGTTPQFLEFFGLKSLRDLPTLKEFTELNEDSRRVVEQELGDVLDARQPEPASGVAEASEVDESGAGAPLTEETSFGPAAPDGESLAPDTPADPEGGHDAATTLEDSVTNGEHEPEQLEPEDEHALDDQRGEASPIEPRDTLLPDEREAAPARDDREPNDDDRNESREGSRNE